jgi:7,8-dihydropterin-6-yl-methyl-4-(beta-D-ribofuranosyl)aminobenzene 5'-phosphate synthase
MGGLAYVLRVNPNVTIYAPKEGFGVYGADLPSSFYRRDESLPAEQRYFGGQPPETLRFGAAWPQGHFKLIDKPTEIAPGVHLIALVSDKPGTLELRELSLALDTPDGLVIVVGCAHPGIDRILETALKINPRIALVVGGLHLVVAKDEEIARIATLMHDTYHVGWVAPGHCTGEPTFKALQAAFGDHDLYAGVGSRIDLGATPRLATAEDAAPMAQADFADWRRLLAGSDDAVPTRVAGGGSAEEITGLEEMSATAAALSQR